MFVQPTLNGEVPEEPKPQEPETVWTDWIKAKKPARLIRYDRTGRLVMRGVRRT